VVRNDEMSSIGSVLLFVCSPILAFISAVAAIRAHSFALFLLVPLLLSFSVLGFKKARRQRVDRDFVTWVLLIGSMLIVWHELLALGREPGARIFTVQPQDSDEVVYQIQQLQTWTVVLCIGMAIYAAVLLSLDGYRFRRPSLVSTLYESVTQRSGIPAVRNIANKKSGKDTDCDTP